jgi:hypothetical protein
MDNSIARIVGGLYIALCSALGEDTAQAAHDVLYGFADNPDFCPEDRRIYKLIADAASRPVDELRAENDRYAWLEANPRPNLRVVGGTEWLEPITA